MLVYGSANEKIDKETLPNPDDFYGGSKLKAEKELQKLADDTFKLCIVRPPMVYGPNCKGNFPRLVELAKKTPLFPDFPNERSMIYIDNLCSFFCTLVDGEKHGLFLPQNSEYVNTTELVKCIAKHSGKRTITTKMFNPLVRLLIKRVGTFIKLFGNLAYAHAGDEDSYNVATFEESVKKSLENSEFGIRNSELNVSQNCHSEHSEESLCEDVASRKDSSVTSLQQNDTPNEHGNRFPIHGRPKAAPTDELNVINSEFRLPNSEFTTSIITTAFNSEKTIKDTLDSVLNQSLPPSEYIIVDGGSKDGTLALAESYRKPFEEKGVIYKIISEPDNGVYDAMNKGILASSGDIIGMINSDDWYEPHATRRAVDTYKNTCYDMMFADIMIHKGDKKLKKKAKLGKWVTSRNWNHPTTFAHKDVYKDNLFPLRSIYDDFNLYLKLRKENKNIVVLGEVLANYRLGGMSNQKGLSVAWKRAKLRYSLYRNNGYSRIYVLECYLIELAKFLITS
jgi:hypothetical protein